MLVAAATLLAGAVAGAAAPAASAQGAALEGGAGRADITPPTGYHMMGWVRSDSIAEGQHTRLFARALSLTRGGRRLALVAVDLGSLPEGLVLDVAERVSGLGYSHRDLIISASHTHSAPAGYFNFPAYNTVAPTISTPLEFELGGEADPQLYSFLARQIARAIRRAHRDRAPAVAGWGHTELRGVTENRSLEAHLANHGVIREPGQGSVDEAPGGPAGTINPAVDVLRVDKVRRSRRVPIGIWSMFSNHGTVVKADFNHYSADHHAAAARVAEREIRRRGGVPRGQEVVNAFGNADEGDTSAGLDRDGPAAAEGVGRREARAMLRAWRRAGRGLERRPALARRWTRVCFCGQRTRVGPVASNAIVGLPFLTGSEEGRGPLHDITGVPLEGVRNPVSVGPHGHKLPGVPDVGLGIYQEAVPLTVARVGRQAILTVPGEMTVGMGREVREAAIRELAGTGVRRVAIAGLANDFLQYFTTPAEYDRQHYEGGSTIFGRAASVLLEETLAELAGRLAAGRPAPPPYDSDPRNGLEDAGEPFAAGARSATPISQPTVTQRLGQAELSWQGGPQGLDRPLDRAFVRVERRGRDGWRRVANDFGMQIIWSVDERGRYTARWEAPRSARLGRHRFVVTANGYALRSRPFALRPARSLELAVASAGEGDAELVLRHPPARPNRDITFRPVRARAATVRVHGEDGSPARGAIAGGRIIVRGRPGSTVTIPAGAARDRHGNRTAEPFIVGL